ncbi:MAG: sulfurtransferase complex subunit TusB [Betaproteobacteria bacterium]|nr:sulfurtransferase complex subunit TusB [Betaproteobacteria bacterium]
MLHIVNKSPHERSALADCLARARAGHAVLLIEDAVVAATRGSAATLAAAPAGVSLYVLSPDLQARGLAGQLAEGITAVDYRGFVDLVAAQPRVQSWL